MKKSSMLMILTLTAVLFYVYSLAVDVSVSLTVYKYNPYFFISHEANRYLIRFLSGDYSSFLLIMFANMLFIVLPSLNIIIYSLVDDGYKTAKKYCELLIIVVDVIVFIVGLMHVLGAYSWIVV